MLKGLVPALLVLAMPAMAQDFPLRGQWNVTMPSNPNYVGVVLMDGQRRVTADSPNDSGRPARYLGYVRAADDLAVEMVLTDRVSVTKASCLRESSDLMRCHTTFADGKRSPAYILTRVGPGPAKLTER